MPAGDPLLTRELKDLQDDVSISQRQRGSRREARAARGAHVVAREATSVKPPDERADAADAQKLREQVNEFVEEVTGFFEEAEKNIATHPTTSVLGALLLGVLIGRLLGRH
jgi:hypothetical protein